jgi:hypothetical protein
MFLKINTNNEKVFMKKGGATPQPESDAGRTAEVVLFQTESPLRGLKKCLCPQVQNGNDLSA